MYDGWFEILILQPIKHLMWVTPWWPLIILVVFFAMLGLASLLVPRR